MSPEAELAAVGVGGSGVSRFKTRHDKRLSDAQAGALEAEGDAAAAAGGIPVGMGYITSDGYYKKRIA